MLLSVSQPQHIHPPVSLSPSHPFAVIRLCPSHCLQSPNFICQRVGISPLYDASPAAVHQSASMKKNVLLMMTHKELLLFHVCASAVQPLKAPVSVQIHYSTQCIRLISAKFLSLLNFQATSISFLKGHTFLSHIITQYALENDWQYWKIYKNMQVLYIDY